MKVRFDFFLTGLAKSEKLFKKGIVFFMMGMAACSPSTLLNYSEFAKPVGELKTDNNHMLQSNINSFMESKGHSENYHCGSFLHGYDDKYAYARVLCIDFIVRSNGDIQEEGGFCGPIRLEFKQPNYEVIAFRRPEDGENYGSSLRYLFPKAMYDKDDPNGRSSKKIFQMIHQEAVQRVFITTKETALTSIKQKYPELRDYPSNNEVSKTISVEQDERGKYYVVFVSEDTSRSIREARCFVVKQDAAIIENGRYSSKGSEYELGFSVRSCMGNALLSFFPVETTVRKGEEFAVDIMLSNVKDLSSVAYSVIFDNASLQLVNIEEGDFLKRNGQKTSFYSDFATHKSNRAVIGHSLLKAPGVSGAGVLAKITFRALNSGKMALSFAPEIFDGNTPNKIGFESREAWVKIE